MSALVTNFSTYKEKELSTSADTNSSLSSPYRNTDFEFSILDSKNIENLYSKMESCGKESIAFVNS